MANEITKEQIEEVIGEIPAAVGREVERQREAIDGEPEPEPKKTFKKIIQPLDANGNAIGSPHVYEAETQEALEAKMAEAIANGTRKIHELTRKVVLETPKEPEGAELIAEGDEDVDAPVWNPKELNEDEKFLIKTDPDKAFGIQFKAEFGMTPAEFRKYQKTQDVKRKLRDEDAKVTREKAETDMFTEGHPEFYRCNENKEAIIEWMTKHPKLAWRKKNLDLAYKELSESGLLKTKPVEVAPVVVEPAPEARTEPQAVKQPDFPTVIRNNSSRATAPIKVKDGKPTAEEIANMSADEYAKHYPELQQAR